MAEGGAYLEGQRPGISVVLVRPKDGPFAQTMPMPNRLNRIAATWAPSSVGSKIELTMMATVPTMQKSIRPAVRLVSGEPVSPMGTPHPPEPAQEHEKPQSEADEPRAGEHVKRRVVGAPQRQRLGLGLAGAHPSDVRGLGPKPNPSTRCAEDFCSS